MDINNKYSKKRICFISAVHSLNEKATSTDIMTNNIIMGLIENKVEIILLVVYKKTDNINLIKKEYQDIVSDIIFVPSFFSENPNKYEYIIQLIKNNYSSKKYIKEIEKIKCKLGPLDLIISNKVYFDEIIYGKVLKKQYYNTKYFQYWSDPMAISAIMPESLKKEKRRWIFWWIENRAFKMCDQVIFGTRILRDYQRQIFPKHFFKMKYVDISYNYTVKEKYNYKSKINILLDDKKLLYAGDYNPKIRDIKPLIEACKKVEKYTLDIYGSGEKLMISNNNINIHQRISPEKLEEIKEKFNIHVCILNHSCIQIPGKIFYDIMSDKIILVLADGKAKENIINYLKGYKRFIVCENNSKDIIYTLKKVKNFSYDLEYIRENFSPFKIANDLIKGGLEI